jgi:hypothetical protein
MRIKSLLCFALAGFVSASPVAAASHFVVLSAAHHGFAVPHITRGAVLHAAHRNFGVGVLGAYDPSAGPLGPDDSTGALPPPPPYPPAVYYPAYYAPQTHCVRPKIIYLTDEKPTTAPVRIIYGTAPPSCPE